MKEEGHLAAFPETGTHSRLPVERPPNLGLGLKRESLHHPGPAPPHRRWPFSIDRDVLPPLWSELCSGLVGSPGATCPNEAEPGWPLAPGLDDHGLNHFGVGGGRAKLFNRSIHGNDDIG